MSDLLYEVTDHVGVITLNRPDAMNSLTYQMYADLEDSVRASEARVLVITGSGRAFCAGDDMKQILGSSEPAPAQCRDRAKKTGGLTPAADALLRRRLQPQCVQRTNAHLALKRPRPLPLELVSSLTVHVTSGSNGARCWPRAMPNRLVEHVGLRTAA